jgi:hypothetical protein
MKKMSSKEFGRILVDRKIVEHFRAGISASQVSKITGKGKGYVIKVRDLAEEYGYIEKLSEDNKLFKKTSREMPGYPEALFPIVDNRKSKLNETDKILDPQKLWMKERLELGWSPQTIFEELSVSIPRSNFYRYLERSGLKIEESMKSSPEIIHAPGECLQVDWGKIFDAVVAGKRRAIWAFIGTLGHSRYTMVRVTHKCDFENTMNCLMSMFAELGGVPRKITSDNPKVFVIEASKHEPLLNAGYERFASYYNFTIEALPPSDPQKKGKVERTVQTIRRPFESYDKEKYQLETAQAHIDKKLKILNERRHGGHQMKPIDVFLRDEVTKLKALPELPYELEKIIATDVRDDGYVRYLGKYYRVDQRLKKQEVIVIGNQKLLSIYCKGRLLEVYEKITDSFKMKDCKDHYKETWEKTLNDHGHYIRRAESIGANVARFVQIILARGEGFVDNRIVWGVLTLNKKYSALEVDNACKSAIELSSIHLKTVHSLLRIHGKPQGVAKNKKDNEVDEYKTPGGRFARPMSEYRAHLRLVKNDA